jgi:hypothetical protein
MYISLPNNYLPKAEPVAACVLQNLDGSIKKGGVHLQKIR